LRHDVDVGFVLLVKKDRKVAGPPSKIGVPRSIAKPPKQRTPFLRFSKWVLVIL
jgi:hypothetical protein